MAKVLTMDGAGSVGHLVVRGVRSMNWEIHALDIVHQQNMARTTNSNAALLQHRPLDGHWAWVK
jgi:hypothetical protein